MVREAVRLYRHAILIYLLAVVLPACGLLWLGVRSFERQREALDTLAAENLAAELDAKTTAAAAEAFADRAHPLTRAFFTFQDGQRLLEPHSPLPSFAPAAFAEAEHEELTLGRADLALISYRRLLARHEWDGLVLSRIARCLVKLGRHEEAQATWRTLASEHADARDLSHRPFGIVAAIQGGETEGLFDRIAAGRWSLAADQLAYFLESLDAARAKSVLERYRLAQVLVDQVRSEDPVREGQIYRARLGPELFFYRADGLGRILVLSADGAWIEGTLRPEAEQAMGAAGGTRQELVIYGSATGLVFLILSAGIFLLFRDVSREAQANRLRSDFVSSVSHELKTPITLIRLYGETLLRQGDLPQGERDEFYKIITRESSRLGRLVDRVLTFSRVERGEQQYAFETDDPAPVVAGVVNDYRDWLTHEGFSVDLSLPESGPAVLFDRAALSQAVLNLVDNAAKYSGTSRRIAVRLSERDPDVAIEVEDHGVGIALADQPRIFDRFYRGHDSAHPRGYGLGLFMVRHIIEAHGGRIEVDSEPGRGSVFRVLLPRAAA